jgi:hypothetical protein
MGTPSPVLRLLGVDRYTGRQPGKQADRQIQQNKQANLLNYSARRCQKVA